ncbi:MAG TPA: helix-turn-helix domain-containing protein [Candidatus Nanoarchaeia archaeon]|nr:helix-turn-helix domain-containing protein [Candidatus Nanoarchaeia archaeon]
MAIEDLKFLDLTDNEIRVYLAILKNGKLTGTKIKQITSIANSRVYSAIDSLISKGIIIYEKHQKGRLYAAINPEILKELMKERMEKIEKTIPILKELQSNEKTETESAVFEGLQGFRTALIKLANECPIGETIHIIGFSNQNYKNEKLAAILNTVNKISMKRKHKFKMILDDEENKFFEKRKKEGLSEIRFMGNNFKSPAAIDIFQDYVYILLWDENPYAFIIKNKNIAEGFKIYFNFLWNMAKK